jgi:hypothetical protein
MYVESTMRPRAAFTIVQNESVFLPLWLEYYSRYFAPGDLYVLDHDSDDGSTAGLFARCNVLQVHRDRSFDHAWLNATVTAFQTFLLRSYERVLFVEADEFVVADPAFYDGLHDYIEQCRVPLARCTGFEVVHYPDEEPPIDFHQRPLLKQRRYWHASRKYSKPLLSSAPTVWSMGFHEAPEALQVKPDPKLFLVHLHRIDYGSCVARHQRTAARKWNETDLRDGLGFQNRLVEGDEQFKTWYFRGEDNGGRGPIPERLRNLL